MEKIARLNSKAESSPITRMCHFLDHIIDRYLVSSRNPLNFEDSPPSSSLQGSVKTVCSWLVRKRRLVGRSISRCWQLLTASESCESSSLELTCIEVSFCCR